MSAQSLIAIMALFDAEPSLIPILEEHLDDFDGAVLPHLLLSDVMRWIVSHREDSRIVESVFGWMESRLDDPIDDVGQLVLTSGVEMLPNPGELGSELRRMLPASLARYT